MRVQAFTRLARVAPLLLIGCGDATGPEEQGAQCTDETGSVSVTVSQGLTPTFNWSPSCAVAMILVEEDASDMWGAASDEDTWDDPAAANLIRPPVAYGSAPSGTTTFGGTQPLMSGRTYEVGLWRLVPSSSTAACQQRFENACLLAVHEFVR